MRIGFIVDGDAEFASLPLLLERLPTPHKLLKPLRADVQPYGSAQQIAERVHMAAKVLINQGAQLIILLIDHEQRQICAGQWAAEITKALGTRTGNPQSYAVVVKNRCYENWLIADTSVFSKMPARFSMSNSDKQKIEPNKADHVDAQKLLKACVVKDGYNKVKDAKQIMHHADPLNMAANSRSFRKLLRQIEHPRYLSQSLNPVP